jgi:aspartate/methionine/tyrosine aminotransferase
LLDGRLASAAAFCERLLAEQGVALVPGEALGDGRWVRLSYAASEKTLRQALNRITDFVRSVETKEAM